MRLMGSKTDGNPLGSYSYEKNGDVHKIELKDCTEHINPSAEAAEEGQRAPSRCSPT
eukprot:m.466806 g.466806  ORF g.466806 m.466806 type:complete len:57 (+) comp25557_c0_seq1:195-365(+)